MNRCHHATTTNELSSESFSTALTATIDRTNKMIITANNSHHLELKKVDHKNHQRWNSSSYNAFEQDKDLLIKKSSSCHNSTQQHPTKQRRHICSPLSYSDRYSNIYDKPIRHPIRRLSNDSNTSTISNTSSRNMTKTTSTILSSNDDCCTKVSMTLPKYISFESLHDDDNDIVTAASKGSNGKRITNMPPKYPKREIASEDNNHINNIIDSIDMDNFSDIISFQTKVKPIISTLQPIRCYNNNYNN